MVKVYKCQSSSGPSDVEWLPFVLFCLYAFWNGRKRCVAGISFINAITLMNCFCFFLAGGANDSDCPPPPPKKMLECKTSIRETKNTNAKYFYRICLTASYYILFFVSESFRVRVCPVLYRIWIMLNPVLWCAGLVQRSGHKWSDGGGTMVRSGRYRMCDSEATIIGCW